MALTTYERNLINVALCDEALGDRVADDFDKIRDVTAAEAAVLDGATAGTVVASKVVVADSSKDVTGIRNLTLGTAASTLGTLVLSGNTAGTVTVKTAATAGDWSLTLPADDGDAGEQLQTNGSGVSTWEAAGSLQSVKTAIEDVTASASEVLGKLLNVPVYEFNYAEGARPTTGDFETRYTGVMAEDMPEVMHHGGRIFSPVSAFGQCVLAIKGLYEKLSEIESRLPRKK
jgi:hypothetical protein